MLFDSLGYLFLFLPLVIFFVYHNKNYQLNKYFLIFSSLFFYAYWNINFLPIIITSIFLNYIFAEILVFYKKKILLFLFILFNLSVLMTFKYTDFFIENINTLFNQSFQKYNLAFPLAISFFTFQQITYLVDIFYNEIKKRNFSTYFIFVAFFPQLIAGPIVKYNYIASQYENINVKKKFFKFFPQAFLLISIGLFKKIVLANYFASIVNKGYLNIDKLDFFESWIVTFCFTLQFYFDFSAYVDLALGSALLFGIKLPINFNSPYKSRNLIDFWQRWHITLSTFLNNYLYYPLLKLKKNFNFFYALVITIVVFSLAGLWHGPAWFFVIFGLLHGIGVVVNQINKNYNLIKINYFYSILLTFLYVNFTFIFFRSSNLFEVKSLLNSMILNNKISLPGFIKGDFTIDYFIYEGLLRNIASTYLQKIELISYLVISFLIIFFAKNSNEITNKIKTNPKYLYLSLFLFITSLSLINSTNVFIYFKF
tara:strand:+ start:2374 stop:3819 length:1446 start_codon:yes stop_codon:yes gene_type:complete